MQRNPPASASSCCTPSSSDAAGSAGPVIENANLRSGSPHPLCPPGAGSPSVSHIPGKRPSGILPPSGSLSYNHSRGAPERSRPQNPPIIDRWPLYYRHPEPDLLAFPPPPGFPVRPHFSKGDDPGPGLTGWPLPQRLPQRLQQLPGLTNFFNPGIDGSFLTSGMPRGRLLAAMPPSAYSATAWALLCSGWRGCPVPGTKWQRHWPQR